MIGYVGALLLFAAALASPASGLTPAAPVAVDCARIATTNVRLACTDPGLVEQGRLMAKLYPLAARVGTAGLAARAADDFQDA